MKIMISKNNLFSWSILVGIGSMEMGCGPGTTKKGSTTPFPTTNVHNSMHEGSTVPSICARCDRHANVVIMAVSPVGEKATAYCEACALQIIPDLLPYQRLTMAEVQAQGKTVSTTRMTYEVAVITKSSNLAVIRTLEKSNQPAQGPHFTVRYDSIPEHYREVGATFSLTGTSLEIKLFERSATRDVKGR